MPVFAFDRFVLDTVARQLTREGESIPLTAKVFDTLELLVRANGDTVSRELFMAQLWPDTVVEERNLTVNISTLRKALSMGRDVDYVVTIPRQGYRLAVPVRIVDDEPAAPEAQTAVTRPVSIAAPDGAVRAWALPRWSERARVAFVLGAATVLVSLGAMVWPVRPPTGTPAPFGGGRIAVAVLPFTVAGDTNDDGHLGLGIADNVIAHLSELTEIDVRPLAAVTSASSGGDASAIGRRLGVAHVIDGAVFKDGHVAKVSARIVDVASGATRWSERFERSFDDAGKLEADIPASVAATLLRLVYVERTWAATSQRPANDEAYRAYLEAMDQMNRGTDGASERAIAAFQRTVALDPEYAPGWAGLARAFRMQGYAIGGRQLDVMRPARAAAERAVAANPRLAEAHTALGIMRYTYDWDWAGAEHEFQTAVTLDPTSQDAMGWLGGFQIDMGRYDEGIAVLRRARELNPLSPTYTQTLAIALWRAGRIDEALGLIDEAARTRLNSSGPHWLRAYILDDAGRTADAIEARRTAARLDADDDYLAKLDEAEGRGYPAVLEQELQLRLKRDDLATAAALQVRLGRHDDAMATLERCVAAHCEDVANFGTQPAFRALHRDARFQALLARVKLDQALGDRLGLVE